MIAQGIKFATWCKDACNTQMKTKALSCWSQRPRWPSVKARYITYGMNAPQPSHLVWHPKPSNAMHVMQTWLKMQHDIKIQGIPSVMQLVWQECNVRHTRCKCNVNMDNLSNRIIMLQHLMKQPYIKHETSMQWWLKMVKGQTFTLLKTVAKSVLKVDQYSCQQASQRS